MDLPASFSMDQYAWSHRPLLVFAPAEDHEIVTQLRQRIAATRVDFDEREMVLIEVFDDSMLAGGVRYAASAAAAMREQYEVADDATTVLLVGKDGGVKRRSGSAVSMADVYAQIDMMPMRRDEMRNPR